MNQFALELAKGIEQIALEKGFKITDCIKSAVEVLEKQKEKEESCNRAYDRYYKEMFKGW